MGKIFTYYFTHKLVFCICLSLLKFSKKTSYFLKSSVPANSLIISNTAVSLSDVRNATKTNLISFGKESIDGQFSKTPIRIRRSFN